MNYGDMVTSNVPFGEITYDETTTNANNAFTPSLQLGVAVEVFNDPGAFTKERFESLENQCKNPGFLSAIPRNSIMVRVITGGAGKSSESLFFCYPFFPPHMCMPIKPGETVWLIDPVPGQGSDVLYWMCRAIAPNYVDDVNFTHADRAFMETNEKTELDPPPEAPGFPNGASTDSTYSLSPPGYYETIYTGSFSNQAVNFEPVPRFTKRPGDLAFQGSNNTLICLGEDRGYTPTTRPKPDKTDWESDARNVSNAWIKIDGTLKDDPAGNWVEDIGTLGEPPEEPTKDEAPPPFKIRKEDFKPKEPEYRGTIDIVVGRGQVEGTQPLIIENDWKFQETDKNPVFFDKDSLQKNPDKAIAASILKDIDKDPVSNRFMNPAEGDPDFISDLSRIYVSMKTSGDTNFGLEFADFAPDVTPEAIDDKPFVIMKSEEIRIIARNDPEADPPIDGSIRLVKEGVVGDDRCELNMLAGGFITMDAKKIIIGDGRDDQVYLGNTADQPIILGTKLVTYLNDLVDALNAHTHTVPADGQDAVGTTTDSTDPESFPSPSSGLKSTVAFTK